MIDGDDIFFFKFVMERRYFDYKNVRMRSNFKIDVNNEPSLLLGLPMLLNTHTYMIYLCAKKERPMPKFYK